MQQEACDENATRRVESRMGGGKDSTIGWASKGIDTAQK